LNYRLLRAVAGLLFRSVPLSINYTLSPPKLSNAFEISRLESSKKKELGTQILTPSGTVIGLWIAKYPILRN
jgi:hypothetical protein